MCQKQFGSFFGAFISVLPDHMRITRGTPLFYKFLSSPQIAVTISVRDHHSELKPLVQFGIEAREPWFADLFHLPATVTGEGDNGVGDTPERFGNIRMSSRQHPDHDTTDWPPKTAHPGGGA
jgi:hypothetical protein